ncbi:glutathione S-transferase T3-like [Brassica napus]|uniref:glutathione S-transferase T3-like n=1 Tax=Brassica napus TaxID=3708 RepID=UPI00207AF833|nr:glutathione S-transferase T3-like [Brassica napus]
MVTFGDLGGTSQWAQLEFVGCRQICLAVDFVVEDFPRSLTSNRKLSVSGSRFSEHSSMDQRLRAQISQVPNNENPSRLLSFSHSPTVEESSSRAQTGEEKNKQRCKWTTAEDLVLISSWLNTSKDPVVGNEQKSGTFWKRIATYYNASPKVVGFPKREVSHCKQRWGKINEGVCKFVGSYDAASKQRSSGHNEDDVLKAAHQIFTNDYKLKFSLEHAWRELRNDQKWCGIYGSSQQSSGSKRKRVGEQPSFQSSASMPSVNADDESTASPIGVKAAKANKGKRSVGEGEKIVEGFQQMWELKQKDTQEQFALENMKDKVNKTKLLNSLLSRTEPLNEIEVALKNKLMTEMFFFLS